MKKIQVGFLFAYDYDKLKWSIPAVYDEADRIFIAKDKLNRTWTGKTFEVNPKFFTWLKGIDIANKIEIYEDDFCDLTLSAMENEVRERKMLAEKMGVGNWLIQVDADEIFIDFKKFVKTLRKYDSYLDNPKKHPVQIAAFLIHLYKYTDNGILYVNEPHKFMLATNYPNYKWGRQTKERIIYTDTVLLHETLSRNEEEIRFKIENWGHSHEVNYDFLEKWKKVNEHNYKEFRNFYFMEPERWKELDYFPTKNPAEISKFVEENNTLKLTKRYLFFKNLGQWFKHLFK